jgi:hypothetical protein
MRFLKRGPSDAGDEDFWAWWPGARDRVAAAITSGGFDARLVEEISRAVRTIDPEMGWELAPGRTAQHAFCISPEGNAAIRPAALRWLSSAPPADATWEYHASKQAAPSLMGLDVGGRRFDLEAMRAITSWDATGQRLDVRLWHPGFEGAPEGVRIQVGFVFLDQLLGEDEVERWIGSIDLLDAPAGGRTPAELKAEVARRGAEASGDDHWVLVDRTDRDGQSEVVLVDAALKRIDHPFAGRHAEIGVVMADDGWLPDEAASAALDAEQDDLVRRLDGIAVFAGRTTRRGKRTMHFVAEDTERMRPAIDAWAEAIPDAPVDGAPTRRLKVNFADDVSWSFYKELGVG